jgi:type I restriction enzyme S subunit
MTTNGVPHIRFENIMRPNRRPYELGPTEDANLVGMRLYGQGPFHRELKAASKIQKKSHYVIRENDVIYNKLFAWKGTFGVVPAEFDGMFVSDKFPTYSLDTGLVDRDYLRWYFRFPPLWEQARQMSTGSAALSKLTLNPPRFLDLTIPLPSLPEQQRVVARLNYLAARIVKARLLQRHAAEVCRALRKAMLREMSEDSGTPGHLSRVLLSKPRNGWSARCDNDQSGTAILTLSAVTHFQYDSTAFKRTSEPTDVNAHYWLNEGDLLITRSNTPQLVGHAAIYSGEPNPCIYPDLMMRLAVDTTKADPAFVWYWLQTPLARRFIEVNAKGTSHTMKKISQGVVMDIPFPEHISLEEQRLAVKKLNLSQLKIESALGHGTKAAAALDAALPSILDRAFRGAL